MRLTLPLFLAISVLPSHLLASDEPVNDVYEHCDSPTIGQGELLECLKGNVEKKGNELKAAYAEIESKTPELEKSAIKANHDNWFSSLDAKCKVEDEQVAYECLFDEAQKRLAELKDSTNKVVNTSKPKTAAPAKIKPEHQELFDKAVKFAWTDLVGVNATGFNPNSTNCEQALIGYFRTSIDKPTLQSLTNECTRIIDIREAELKEVLSKPDAKPESCRQLNVLLGKEWLSAEINMKASAFSAPTSTPVSAVGVLNKSNDGLLYIQGNEGYSIAETGEKTVFINKDTIKIGGGVRAYGINTQSRTVTMVSGSANEVPVLAVTCIESTDW